MPRGRVGARRRHRHAEQRVRAEPALRRRAVERDQGVVERALRVEFAADDRRRDFAVDVGDRLPDALAAVPPRIAVTQLQRLALAGGRARRDRRPSGPALDAHVDFDRRIAARIQNLAAVHARDLQTASTNDATTKHDRSPSLHPPPPRRSASASNLSASSLSGPMSGSSSGVTTTTPESVTAWRRRSSSRL